MTQLTKKQTKTFRSSSFVDQYGDTMKIECTIRYDDQCGNGHNSFSITGSVYRINQSWSSQNPETCGCIHDDIKRAFPELEKYIKWHGINSNGPSFYIANTMYHARQHSAKMCHIVTLGAAKKLTTCLKYTEITNAQKCIDEIHESTGLKKELISIHVDEKTAKESDIEAARDTAIWPDATLEQLNNKDALEARLPALIEEFKLVIEELGMVY